MNKTTILAISAVFAVSMIAIIAFEVEAVKPPTEETQEIPTVISFTPMGTTNGLLTGDITRVNAILLYGDRFCGVDTITGASIMVHLYIEFATTMTVEHLPAECSGASWRIELTGNSDAVFQPGDLLVLNLRQGAGNYQEVHREQTI